MSTNFLNLAFNAPVKGAPKAVLIALAFKGADSSFTVNHYELAFLSGCDRRTVMRSITALESLGLLAVTRATGVINSYRLLLGGEK